MVSHDSTIDNFTLLRDLFVSQGQIDIVADDNYVYRLRNHNKPENLWIQ